MYFANANALTNCVQQDYLSVFGGPDFTVLSVLGAIDDDSNIALAGHFTNSNGDNVAYLLLMHGEACNIQWKLEFPQFDLGFKAVTFGYDQLAVVGYSSADNLEYLILVEISVA